jgi:putative ABC transport system ATP-binding protein
VIDLAGITKSYRKGQTPTSVLTGVTLRIDAGELVAIMGPSGSGKSTLLNIVGLLDRPDSGRYLLDGNDVSGVNDDDRSALRNRRIGFVFQQFHLMDRVPAVRNVMLPLLYAPDGDDTATRANAALDEVGLAHRATHLPGELSGGEQQRVAIARALVTNPSVILADEPTGNLDAKTGGEILDLFASLHRRGRTIVIVTHDRAVAERAGRVLLLQSGRIEGDTMTGERPAAAAGV